MTYAGCSNFRSCFHLSQQNALTLPGYRSLGVAASAAQGWITCLEQKKDRLVLSHRVRAILIGDLFSQIFDIVFAQIFQSFIFSCFFFPKYVKFNELDFFASGAFRE